VLARALLAAVALVAVACSASDDDRPAPTTVPPTTSTTVTARENVDGTLTIGALLPLTGLAAPLGTPMLAAVEMAVEEINAAGGVNGRSVRLVVGDEGADSTTAAVALDRMLDVEQIDALVGPASSRVALALLDRAVSARVLTCSPTNTAIALSSFPSENLYFRTMPSDELQGTALARAIATSGRRSTSILYPDDDYGRGFLGAMRTELDRLEIGVTTATAYDATATDITPAVTAAVDADPESVAVIGLAEPGARLLAGLADAGARPSVVPTFVSDGMRRSSLFELVDPGRPDAVAGIQGTSPSAVPAGATWFTTAFEAHSGSGSLAYAPYAYDCVNLVALSAVAAGTDDALAVATRMVSTSRSGTVCNTFAECLPLLADARNIDLDGASGPIELRPGGDPSVGTYDLFTFDDQGRDALSRQLVVTARAQ